jgi:hypothetical protein
MVRGKSAWAGAAYAAAFILPHTAGEGRRRLIRGLAEAAAAATAAAATRRSSAVRAAAAADICEHVQLRKRGAAESSSLKRDEIEVTFYETGFR